MGRRLRPARRLGAARRRAPRGADRPGDAQAPVDGEAPVQARRHHDRRRRGLGDRGRRTRSRAARRRERRAVGDVLRADQRRAQCEPHGHRFRRRLRVGARAGPRRCGSIPRTAGRSSRIPTPLAASWIVFAGGAVWVASAENGRIVKIDPATNRVSAATPLHGTVTDMAVERLFGVGLHRPRQHRLPAERGRRERAGDHCGRPLAVIALARRRALDRRCQGASDRPRGRDRRAGADPDSRARR